MRFHYDHPLINAGWSEVIADIEYSITPASGDGWNEPRERAWPEIQSVTLRQSKTNFFPKRHEVRSELGPAPQWLFDMLCDDEDLMGELLAEASEEVE